MDVFILAIEVQKEILASVHSTLDHAATRLYDWVIDNWDDEIVGHGPDEFETVGDATDYFFELLEDDYSYTISQRPIDAAPEFLCKGFLAQPPPGGAVPQAAPAPDNTVFMGPLELKVMDTALRYVPFDLALEKLAGISPGDLVQAIGEIRAKLK